MSTSIPVRRKNTQNTITSPPPVTVLNTQDLKSNVPQTEITTQDFRRQNPIISGMSSQQPWVRSCQLLYVIGHGCLIRNHFNLQSKQ